MHNCCRTNFMSCLFANLCCHCNVSMLSLSWIAVAIPFFHVHIPTVQTVLYFHRYTSVLPSIHSVLVYLVLQFPYKSPIINSLHISSFSYSCTQFHTSNFSWCTSSFLYTYLYYPWEENNKWGEHPHTKKTCSYLQKKTNQKTLVIINKDFLLVNKTNVQFTKVFLLCCVIGMVIILFTVLS